MADRDDSSEEVAAPPQHAAVEPSSMDTAGATTKKQRLSHEYVSYILTMRIEEKLQHPDNLPSYLRGDNPAELLDVTEEWLEEKRLAYRERAARDQRIHADRVQFQNRVRGELLEKGYVEVDDDDFTNIAKMEEEASARWEEVKKKEPDPGLTLFGGLADACEKQAMLFLGQ